MKKVVSIAVLGLVIGVGYWLFFAGDATDGSSEVKGERSSTIAEERADRVSALGRATHPEGAAADSGENEASEDGSETPTEEDELAQAEAKLVDEFDAETDRWMDAEKSSPPTVDQVNAFRDKFKKLPKNRKDECLHRALNLIPDENVMLLVGVLMDKSEDKEMVELVYNDILNRDETVKKPILEMIFRDKEHCCWADTAWILDVTGELPKKN